MSLITCPECGNQVSDQAVACPKCGRPFEAPTVVVPPPVVPRPEPIIVAETPRKQSFPNWIFVPIIVILAVVALFMFLMMRDNSANENDNRTQVNVRLRESETAARTNSRTVSSADAQTGTTTTTSETVTTTAPTTGTAPVSQIPSSTSSVPQTAYPTTGTTSNLNVSNSASDKGNLEIKATVAGKTGSTQPVRQERFYLLDKSLDEILSRANIEPEEGDLASTCAAAVIDPARRATREKCLAAINPHIVYRLQTDGSGKGTFKNVKPDSYYVFGVTKVGTDSYALWNTTVTVNPGENLLNLNGSGSPLSPVGLNNSSNY